MAFDRRGSIILPNPIIRLSHTLTTLRAERLFILARFVPEGEFDAVPETEFVVDATKIVLDDVLGGSDGICDLPIFESLRNECDDLLFSFIG